MVSRIAKIIYTEKCQEWILGQKRSVATEIEEESYWWIRQLKGHFL
jgi:hypothetical protein